MKRKFSYKTLNSWLKSRKTDWKLGKRYLQCYILRYWNEAVFIEQKYEKFSNGRQFHQQQHESIISLIFIW